MDMLGYAYLTSSLIINGKINNVEYIEIDENTKKIIGTDNNGNNAIVTFDGGSDYIILENDIDKNIGDTIDLTNLVDARDYFLKGKDYWYQEKLKNQEDLIINLKNMNDIYGSTLDSLMFDILPNLITTESNTTPITSSN
jgi:hypothetical protein